MIIIGELINASRKVVKAAIAARDTETIQQLAIDQCEAGADYIDVNAGVFVEDEPKQIKWLVETVQSAVDCPCALDSPNPAAIEAALGVHQGTAMINSISLEKDRLEALLPMIAGSDLKVYVLDGTHKWGGPDDTAAQGVMNREALRRDERDGTHAMSSFGS